MPEVHEEAFDPQLKMMATYHRMPECAELRVAVKGAAEAVLRVCTRERLEDGGERSLSEARRAVWNARAEALGEVGLRVLAVACRDAPSAEQPPYADLSLLGLVALLDPPRASVAPSIEACQRAGLRVVMVTGDHPGTALNIARAVGIAGPEDRAITGAELERVAEQPRGTSALPDPIASPVVARATPEQKLILLARYQEAGATVAMIGDGVNDAPALRQADIGVAMGKRGTAVAREASDMVLRDDNFGTIVLAVGQGRIIFDNIRKFVVYLLGCNLSEILVIGVASTAGAPLPILPLQILFLNLVTDVFPALSLGVGEGDPGIMDRRPRPRAERIMRPTDWGRTVVDSLVLSVSVLAGSWLALERMQLTGHEATTISFLILAFAQVFHVFNLAERDSPVIVNEVSQNPAVWGAVVLCFAIVLAGTYVPGLASVLLLRVPDAAGWSLVLVMSLLPLVVGRVMHAVLRRRQAAAPP